ARHVHVSGEFRQAEQAMRVQLMRTIGMVILLQMLAGVCAMAADPAKELTPERRGELEKEAEALTVVGERYSNMGNYLRAIEVMCEALEVKRALYPKGKSTHGDIQLASSLHKVGMLYETAGEYRKAEPFLCEALDIMRALFPKTKYP